MGIGAADHAELEGIDAELRFLAQAQLQGGTGVGLCCQRNRVRLRLFRSRRTLALLLRSRRRFVGLGWRGREAAHRLVVSELIGRRYQRVGLTVSLGLGHLDDGLPARTRLRVGRREGLACKCAEAEHVAPAQVGVVGDGKYFASRPVLVVPQVCPEILRVTAVEAGERHHLSGLVGTAFKEHVSVDHVRLVRCRPGAPLIADECGERARVVMPFRVCDDPFPDCVPKTSVEAVVGAVCAFCQSQEPETAVVLIEVFRLEYVPQRWKGSKFLRPAPTCLGCRHPAIVHRQSGQYAEILGVIRHHEKVQRSAQAHVLAARGSNRLTLGESIRLVRRQSGAQGEGVTRQRGVYMCIAPVDIGGEGIVGMRRIRFAGQVAERKQSKYVNQECRFAHVSAGS